MPFCLARPRPRQTKPDENSVGTTKGEYQESERHLAFVDENKATWMNVRVFDSYVVV
jgi:hypothetical protein